MTDYFQNKRHNIDELTTQITDKEAQICKIEQTGSKMVTLAQEMIFDSQEPNEHVSGIIKWNKDQKDKQNAQLTELKSVKCRNSKRFEKNQS